MRILCICVVAIVAFLSSVFAGQIAQAGKQSVSVTLKVDAGKHERRSTPVRVRITVPKLLAKQAHAILLDANGKSIPAQVTAPALLDPAVDAKRSKDTGDTATIVLWWMLPELAAGKSAIFRATIAPAEKPVASEFAWRDEAGKHTDLLSGDRPVVRYMYQAYEDDPSKRDLNNKPFHHMFDPDDGSRLVTKGSGGQYTHHQGLYYGFTRCTVGKEVYNTWYCHNGEHELHKRVVNQTTGPVLARHQTEIAWNDTKGRTFCNELRELAAFSTNGGTLVEWSSRLRTLVDSVTLDGDSQHAGFQFRAADEVAGKDGQKLTYFLRPDVKGKPGETRNPVRGKPDAPASKLVKNMPWHVMSFVVGGTRYSAVYIDSPKNPKPSFSSERSYGRFGSWFGKQSLTKAGPPIDITYRVWLQRGEMTADQATALSTDFADPPIVTVTEVR